MIDRIEHIPGQNRIVKPEEILHQAAERRAIH
jgi:hypothetical protein